MKLFILAFFPLALAANVSDCKVKCSKMKRELLQDLSSSVCKKASNLHPMPQLFQKCIEGRKRGFDQCASICLGGVNTTDSFDGCKASKGNAAKPQMMQWCRQGYDEIIKLTTDKFAMKESMKEPVTINYESVVISEEEVAEEANEADLSEYEAQVEDPEDEVLESAVVEVVEESDEDQDFYSNDEM